MHFSRLTLQTPLQSNLQRYLARLGRCGLLALTACSPNLSASLSTNAPEHVSQDPPVQYLSMQDNLSPNRVNANDYDAFWIWGNIRSAPYLSKAKEIYILQGEIHYAKAEQQSVLTAQGVSVLRIPHQKVWLVFRTRHLDWNEKNLALILSRMQQWENQGNQIQGLQIDFDSKTHNLKQYALFLQQLRQKLPKQYQLSITGLLDWTNFSDADSLNIFRQNIDELILQSYQGTTTIPNYQAYLKRVSALNLPYKIGVVQHGIWSKSLQFEQDPNFKGYVVFLLRDPKTQ